MIKYIHTFLFVIAVTLVSTAQEVKHISLQEAQELSMQQNRLLKIARYREQESRDSVQYIRSRYYPNVDAAGGYLYNVLTDVTLRQGSLGNVAGTPVPGRDYKLFEGNHHLLMGSVRISQPVSQLGKINAGVKAAQVRADIAHARTRQAEMQVKQGVEKLYYGLLIAQKQKEQAALSISLSELQLYDVESALMAGETDSTKRFGLLAQLAAQQQKLLQVNHQLESYTADMNELLGLPATTRLSLQELPDSVITLLPLQAYTSAGNQDLEVAGYTSRKAGYGVTAARREFIPDLSFISGYTYQNIIDLLPDNNYHAGLLLSWKILDWGTRRSVLNQRLAQQKEAAAYLEYMQEHVNNDIQKAYRNVTQAQQLVQAARKAVTYRQEALRFVNGQLAAGKVLPRDVLQARYNLAQAATDLFSAQLNCRIALTDLEILTGLYE